MKLLSIKSLVYVVLFWAAILLADTNRSVEICQAASLSLSNLAHSIYQVLSKVENPSPETVESLLGAPSSQKDGVTRMRYDFNHRQSIHISLQVGRSNQWQLVDVGYCIARDEILPSGISVELDAGGVTSVSSLSWGSVRAEVNEARVSTNLAPNWISPSEALLINLGLDKEGGADVTSPDSIPLKNPAGVPRDPPAPH